MRPLLMMLGDYRSLTLNVVNRLTSVTRLFPNSFNDKFCDQMMVRNCRFCRPLSSLSHSINNQNNSLSFSATPEEVDGGGCNNTQGRPAQWWQCKYTVHTIPYTPHSTEKFNANVKLPSCITCGRTLCLLVIFSRNLVSMQYRSSQRL